MSRAVYFTTLNQSWTGMEPVRLGRIQVNEDTADRFVVVESDNGPLLRADLYKSSDECFAFEAVCLWSCFRA